MKIRASGISIFQIVILSIIFIFWNSLQVSLSGKSSSLIYSQSRPPFRWGSRLSGIVSPSCSCRALSVSNKGITPAYTAITVDTRFELPLIFSIRHMACTLPNDWVIMLISHYSMRYSILFEFSDLLRSGKLRVWELSTSVRTLRELCPNFEVNDWSIGQK